MTWLAQHIGKNHRLYALDTNHIRCKDCQQTGVVGNTSTAVPASTSTPGPLGVKDPTACPSHLGQRQGSCGPCRAENVEAPPMERVLTGTDPRRVPEWQAARDALAAKKLDRANGATS